MKAGTTSIFLKLLLPLVCLLSACESGFLSGRISEGTITYDVSYPYLEPDHYMKDFLPDEMTMQFADNQFVNELSAAMGFFRTGFINNSNNTTLTQMVRMGNDRMYANLSQENVQEVLDDYPVYTIIELDETKMIAGLKCQKALIIYDDVDTREFYIYYTRDIQFENPNWSTPFASIDGVLMEYEIKQLNLTMRLSASSVAEAEHAEDVFQVPEEYENVTFHELQQEIEDVLATL